MLGCAVVLAPSASAGKPFRIPTLPGDVSTYPAGTVCSFTLETELVGGNQVLTIFDDGRIHLTGRHIDRFTNVEADTSTTLDLQGNFGVVPSAEGGSILRASGVTGFVFFPGDAGPGNTENFRMYLFTGHFVAVLDPSGVVTAFTSTGKRQDVCTLFA